MKLSELKTRLKNKYVVRIVAGVLTIALLGSSMTAVAVQADQKKDAAVQTEQKEDSSDKKDDIEDLLQVSVSDKEIGKDENVYLISDATGSVYDTIVTDHLINKNQSATLEDQSNLTDIKNVKGSEEFSQNGEKLTWQADGADIYYQGKTDSEAPVSLKVTYYLDGNEIAPKDLAGKSGKVTIHYDYTNNSSYEETVNGNKQTVKVPFAAVTALVLDDSFSNVEVKNGKVSQNGDSNVVIGYALPGIKESLNVKDSDFIDDLELPEDFEVTADVKDFKLDTAMTIVANAGSMISMKSGDSSSLDDMIDDMLDASSKLKDGSKELSDGLDTLQKNLADYASGMNELNSKSGDLGKGVETLNTSAESISKGIQTLDKALNTKMSDTEKQAASKTASETVAKEFANGKTQEVAKQIYAALRYSTGKDGSTTDGALFTSLYDGAYSANAAETVYNEVVRQVLLKAAGQAADSKLTADQAAAGIKAAWAKGAQANDQTSTVMYAVSDGMTSAQLAAGRNNEQVTDGVESSLKTLATQLAGACQNVAVQAASAAAVTGAESAKATIAQQIEAVQENGYSLVTGSAALSKGTQSLADAVPTLTKGIKALNDATVKIVSGVDKLDDGSHTLADGMVEFDEKGISKIANSYNGDIKPLTDKLQAMLDAGEDYQTFTKVADGVNGSVKFIYKQDAIKADSENNK